MSTFKKHCVHCLKPLTKETKDHVFPRSWYTSDTPNNVQRWTVPSCEKCNNKLGSFEKELFIRLALCVEPNNAKASGINHQLKKVLGIGENLSDKERSIRNKKLKEILQEVQPYTGQKHFPGLGLHDGYSPNLQKTIPVPEECLFPVLEKIFKGTEYILGKRYVQHPYKLKIYHVYEEPVEVKRIMESFACSISLGPGFIIQRAVSNKGDCVVIYKAVIWGKLVSYASIDTL